MMAGASRKVAFDHSTNLTPARANVADVLPTLLSLKSSLPATKSCKPNI
jgi:hypothetical protein